MMCSQLQELKDKCESRSTNIFPAVAPAIKWSTPSLISEPNVQRQAYWLDINKAVQSFGVLATVRGDKKSTMQSSSGQHVMGWAVRYEWIIATVRCSVRGGVW